MYRTILVNIFLFTSFYLFSQSNKTIPVFDKINELMTTSTTEEEIHSIINIIKENNLIFNLEGVPLGFPLQTDKFVITSLFGDRTHPIEQINKKHLGLDISAKIGTLVSPSTSGTVEKIEFSDTGHGRRIIITHKYGFKTVYSHLSIILVKEGIKVQKGDVIGMVGSTGQSTGNHLHYEIHKNGIPIDPAQFILY